MIKGSGGGGAMRAVGRAVGAGVGGLKGAILTPTRPSRAARVAASAVTSSPPSPSFAAAADGEGCSSLPRAYYYYDGHDDYVDDGIGFSERYVFGSAPTREEVGEAVSTLQQIFVPVSFSHFTDDGCPPFDKGARDKMTNVADQMPKDSSSESESDWIEPTLHLHGSQNFQSEERASVLDAFRLLQINPSIQRMVVSLSSDKAVWDAVMNNEAVQELKKSFYGAEGSEPRSSDDRPNIATTVLRWILDNTKAKMDALFDMVSKLVNKLFHSQEKEEREENSSDSFGSTLRSSFMLTIIVFIIVVVTRIQKT